MKTIVFEGQKHQFPDNFTDDDISSALGGTSQVQPAEQPGMAADVAKSFGIGVPKGLISLAGLPGDIAELGARGINAGVQGIGGALGLDVGPPRQPQAPTYGTADITKGVESLTGPLYQPQTTAGKYAQTVGEFIPAAAAGPGGIARRIALNAVVPGLASEAAGQATEGTALEPVARVGAALAAPAAVRRLATPLPSNVGRQAMVDTLAREGIPVSAGQATGVPSLKYAESFLGDAPFAGGKATKLTDKQSEAFTRAAFKRIGMDDVPTPSNINKAVQDIQDEFTRLSASTVVKFDQPFAQDVTQTLNRYYKKLPSQQREIVDNYVNDMAGLGGRMPGAQYQIARSDLSRQANAIKNSDPTLSGALRGLRDALDNAMGRSIPAAEQKAWQTARKRWDAWRTLEGAAKETDAAGNVRVSPAALKQAAATRDRGGFARGRGQFNELARAGNEVMRALPNSGTAQRNMLTALAMGGAGGAYSMSGDPAWLLGLGGPALAGRALMSRYPQRYLANQALRPPPQYPLASSGLLGALAAQPRGLLSP